MAEENVSALAQYSACDISDALLKLKVPKAGHLLDFKCFAPISSQTQGSSERTRVIAAASTALFVPKDTKDSFEGLESNIPSDRHYVDLTKNGSMVVLSQTQPTSCAILGGIMATRMKQLSAQGVVVEGRVRDIDELQRNRLPVWALGTSTVGTGAELKPWAIGIPVTVQGVEINPGDIIFADSVDGVVAIPQTQVDAVLELLPKLTQADEKVMEDLRDGSTVKEAFAKHRGNL